MAVDDDYDYVPIPDDVMPPEDIDWCNCPDPGDCDCQDEFDN